MKEPSILIIDDNKFFCEMKAQFLRDSGLSCDFSNNPKDGLEKIKKESFDVVLLDLQIGDINGIDVIPKIKNIDPGIAIIILTGFADVHSAVEAVKRGAYDYLSKEVQDEEILLRIEKAVESRNNSLKLQDLKRVVSEKYGFDNIIGKSKKMSEVYSLIEAVSANDVTLLIHGETGTGKELIARAIHFNSPRKEGPFWEVNCSAITETLMESELFGHEKGAFTGAFKQKLGKVELADNGTLFLDEIGDMPLPLQAKVLRFLQEKIFERVGGTEKISSNVRIISATHRDLEKMIAENKFREDLFYRLNVVKIEVPPLKERIEDLPLLIGHFLNLTKIKYNKDSIEISKEAMDILLNYNWPGNVREVENLIEKIVLTSKETAVSGKEIERHLRKPIAKNREYAQILDFNGTLDNAKDQVEKEYLGYLMDKFHGNIRLMAETAGLDKRSIYYKINKHHIEKV